MQRLLQGEVGSGKTVVALMAMAMAADSGYQSVLMAPTELLAQQHAHTIVAPAEAAGLRVTLLRGKQKVAQRREILHNIANHDADIVVGTHAVLEEKLAFHKLGLVVVDEQHRFGVEQRSALRSKGTRPHLLLMTATPIPRTLRLSQVGDLDESILKELPGGPRRVQTLRRGELDRDKIYRFLIEQTYANQRCFIICPLVEESEKVDTEAAIDYHQRVSRGALREVKVGLLHGRMTSDEKQIALDKFRSSETPILDCHPRRRSGRRHPRSLRDAGGERRTFRPRRAAPASGPYRPQGAKILVHPPARYQDYSRGRIPHQSPVGNR